MQHLFRGWVIGAVLMGALFSAGGLISRAAEWEYKLADQNFYARASVLKAEPAAVVLSAGTLTERGDSYFLTGHRKKAPLEIYIEVSKDWLEPVTPPSMPDSLGLAPDAMQVREPHGDVQLTPAAAGGLPGPAADSLPVPNGSSLKTGHDGSAAVLFGGVDSARLAPNSEMTVQQTVTPDLRTTRIELKSGIVFSKVGLRPGEKQDYEVHTPNGTAFAKGTDFVCLALPDRTDVVVVQGTVQFKQDGGPFGATVEATGKGAPKIIRFPVITDTPAAMLATSQTLTTLLDFLPTVNMKLKTLHDQMAQGIVPSAEEKKYLGYLKRITCLQKLSLIAPPPAAPVAPAAAHLSLPPETNAPPKAAQKMPDAPPPSTVESAPPVPPVAPAVPTANPAPKAIALLAMVIIDVAFDGSFHLDGEQLSAGHLERKLAKAGGDNPDCAVTVRGNQRDQGARIDTVLAMCREAKLAHVAVEPRAQTP